MFEPSASFLVYSAFTGWSNILYSNLKQEKALIYIPMQVIIKSAYYNNKKYIDITMSILYKVPSPHKVVLEWQLQLQAKKSYAG